MKEAGCVSPSSVTKLRLKIIRGACFVVSQRIVTLIYLTSSPSENRRMFFLVVVLSSLYNDND